jgi:hypothetical protein
MVFTDHIPRGYLQGNERIRIVHFDEAREK